MLVLEVNVGSSDSKSAFQNYVNTNSVEFPAVWYGDGGWDLATATGNGGSGNPKYVIYPDKTFAKTGTIPSSIQPHVCGPYLTLSWPNGGDALEQGSTYTIIWSSSVSGEVKIELFKGSTLNKVIADSAPNNDSFDWEITTDYTPGDDYKVKITSLENTSLIGESGANFSITEELIIAIPYTQTFDGWSVNTREMDYWEQLTDDDIDWTIQSGPTPSRVGSTPDMTGAEADHTSGSGKYIYVEASNPNNPDKATSIITPKFDFSSLQDPMLTLYYHMFSAEDQMGTFSVDVKVGDNDWQENIIEVTGDQGDAWNKESVDLSTITQNNQRVRFRLQGVTGSGWQSDICIDDFQILQDVTPITNIKTPALPYELSFNNFRIHYRIPDTEKQMRVSIKLYNVQGKIVRTLVDKAHKAGSYSVEFNKKQLLSSGVYLCRMETDGFQKIIMILNK